MCVNEYLEKKSVSQRTNDLLAKNPENILRSKSNTTFIFFYNTKAAQREILEREEPPLYFVKPYIK